MYVLCPRVYMLRVWGYLRWVHRGTGFSGAVVTGSCEMLGYRRWVLGPELRPSEEQRVFSWGVISPGPRQLNFYPQTHMVEEEHQLPQLVLWPRTPGAHRKPSTKEAETGRVVSSGAAWSIYIASSGYPRLLPRPSHANVHLSERYFVVLLAPHGTLQ